MFEEGGVLTLSARSRLFRPPSSSCQIFLKSPTAIRTLVLLACAASSVRSISPSDCT